MATAGLMHGTIATRRPTAIPAPSRGRLAFGALVLFIAIVYTNPANLFPEIGDYGYAKIAAALSLLALGGAWLLGDLRLGAGGAVGKCLLAFFALVGLSASWSLWPSLSVDTFTEGVKYLAIFVVVANVVTDGERARTMLHVLAWASLVPAIGTMHSWAVGEHLVDGDRVGWVGIFANPNDLAYHLVVGIAMALGARATSKSTGLRWAYLGVIAALVMAILLTQSRGGLLGAGAVMALWGIRNIRQWRAGLLVVGALVVGVQLAPDSVWQRARGESVVDASGNDASARGRIDAWRTGLNVAADRPLTGVGAGAFMLAWPEYAPGDAGAPRTAHNTFIQLVAETGVPSLLLFIGAVAAAGVGLVRAARRRPDLTTPVRAVEVGLAGFVVCSATGGLAYTWPVYLLLGFAAGLWRDARTTRAATATTPVVATPALAQEAA